MLQNLDQNNSIDSISNILVANNDPFAQQAIKDCLSNAGYAHITLVDSAKKALIALRQHTFDLLILDVDTQDMDGWRLSRLVRCGILNCRTSVPIIIVASTWCQRIAEVTAREYGINYLLPLNHINRLSNVVQHLLSEKNSDPLKPRLLVIEDSQDTSDLIQRVLANTFDIDVAADGEAGLMAWKTGRHDLVLLDVMLPTLSGRNILIEIQRTDSTQPVVIMTAHTTIDQAEELMFLGAVDFLPKPFRAEQLRKVCNIAIHRDDYLVSNSQFATHVKSLEDRELQLLYLATHDSLTGFYNRHFFETTIEELSKDAIQQNRLHGLVYLDLDHFKVINDTFGHQKGDEVLREISTLISKRIRGVDTLCRLGGDEFAVLLHDTNEKSTLLFAQEIQKLTSEFNFQSQDQRINLSCSIGIVLIDNSTHNHEEYLMRADIALYVAKGRGRNLIHQYNSEDNESDELRRRISVSQKVRNAITDNRLILYFQPIFDIHKNKISYYEALVRLQEINGDIIGPNEFIPALEASGEMHLLDRWVIKLATRTLAEYPELHHIAINLSAQAFKDETLVPTIVENLKISNVNPNRITFELTESASLFNLNITQRVIAELHQLGCSFSVDDFGSGFSSFAYLKDLPADYIKLDGSFIQNLHKDTIDQALVKSMIQVIQALGKKAVAEYVENEEILNILKSMGIDFVQGYYIGRPIPVEKILLQKIAQ